MPAAGRSLLRIAFLALALLVVGVGVDTMQRPLANPDEGRYSEISREMAASGDWITPRLNGIKYLEKPPLQYWASAAVFKTLGEGEFTARIYVALCGLLALLLVGYTAARLATPATGLLTGVVLASSPYFMALGGIVTLDMGLTAWTTASLCGFLLAQAAPAGSRARRNALLLAWTGAALAVLSKGLVGLVLPAAALVLYALVRRDARVLLPIEWLRGGLLFLAVAAPWFIAVSIANPEFPEFFFIHEHVTRFTSTAHRRSEPAWFFVPILFAGFLPWMFALPAAVRHAWVSERGAAGFQPLRFCLLWSVFVVGFFSLSGSKLPHYILPAFPALAIVLGHYVARAPERRLAAWVLPVAPLALLLAWLVQRAPQRASDPWVRSMYESAQPWAYAGIAALFLAAVVAAILLWRGRRWWGVLVLALGTTVLIDCIEDAYEGFSERQSGKIVATKAAPHVDAATRLYSVRHYDQTLPFYLRRTLTLVDYVDEFETGLRAQPGLALRDTETYVSEWLKPGSAVAIMNPDTYETLRQRAVPMQVLHEDRRRVLVRKP